MRQGGQPTASGRRLDPQFGGQLDACAEAAGQRELLRGAQPDEPGVRRQHRPGQPGWGLLVKDEQGVLPARARRVEKVFRRRAQLRAGSRARRPRRVRRVESPARLAIHVERACREFRGEPTDGSWNLAKLEYAGLSVVFSGDTRPCQFVTDAAAGADLLIHESFQSPAVAAKAWGVPLETALRVTESAHTIPGQMARILDLPKPGMAALWNLDVSPGVGGVFEEIREQYGGPVAICQDLTSPRSIRRGSRRAGGPRPRWTSDTRTLSAAPRGLRRPLSEAQGSSQTWRDACGPFRSTARPWWTATPHPAGGPHSGRSACSESRGGAGSRGTGRRSGGRSAAPCR